MRHHHIARHGGHPTPAFLRQHMLQFALWTLWTVAVVATAGYEWHHDLAGHIPFNTLAMVIHCTLVGIFGLIMITNVELWLDTDL